MQNLLFDEAWERTISDSDREKIKHAFIQTIEMNCSFSMIPIWRAVNYKGDLLVTTLIHNPTEKDEAINQKLIQYSEDNDTLAEHEFTNIHVSAYTSMPWTFIFPKDSIRIIKNFPEAREENPSGILRIIK